MRGASFQYKVEEPGLTVEALLRERWAAGKKTVHQLRMDKGVLLEDGTPVLDWKEPLEAGTVLTLQFPGVCSSYTATEHADIQILFEDEHLIAAVKPAGMATHPDREGGTGTFMNEVMGWVSRNGGCYAEHIQRLDKGTSGLILVAKHPIAKALLDRALERNEISRTYIAEVDGIVKRPRGTLSFAIGRDRHHATRRRVSPSGQPAVTHYQVMEKKQDSTIVEARLDTGRTHQIRVHFSHIGHPVKGDTVYGGTLTDDGEYRLTAVAVSFIHPFTGEQMNVAMK